MAVEYVAQLVAAPPWRLLRWQHNSDTCWEDTATWARPQLNHDMISLTIGVCHRDPR